MENAIHQLAHCAHSFSEADLAQPWRWRRHQEGVRFALLGSYHELRDLALTLAARRAREGPPRTKAQRALAQYLAAYRDLQAVLAGVVDEIYDEEPAPAEWPLRYVVGHMVDAQRTFFSLVHYGLARQRDGRERPSRFPNDAIETIVGPRADFRDLMENQDIDAMLAYFDTLHQRTLTEFVGITDAELEGPSLWWEEEEYSLQYRLHRFDAHLRQHTIQAEKTLVAIGRPPNEAKRLLRLVYNALAELEGVLLGAPALGAEECRQLATAISQRAESVEQVVTQARQMETAVKQGDLDRLDELLLHNPELVHAVDQNRRPLLLTAQYFRQTAAVERLLEAGAEEDIFTAAALGRLEVVQAEAGRWPEDINEFNRDGFTPLQLACFFNHEAVALWLVEQGADVNAVAHNPQKIAPIHAAAAGGNLTIVRALLRQEADANARQQQGFTPLHTAADNDDPALAKLLLAHGADPSLADDNGQTPLDLALAKGNKVVATVLRRQGD